MNLFTLKVKLILAAVAAVVLIGAGIWFRGVIAENKELRAKTAAQVAEIAAVTGEIERMNRQDAVDRALFEHTEQRKAQITAELARKIRELKQSKENLDVATRNCLDLVLPADYLARLPQAPN